LDDDRFDNTQKDMINELNSQQINVKNYDLGTQQLPSTKSLMGQKRTSSGIGGGIGSGIGGGLRRPTMLKQPSKASD